MKKVILVHGWGGSPESGWFPWLQKELEVRGFEVVAPQLPEPATPHMRAWVAALTLAAGEVGEETYFVGHSMGCPTIIRYLESLPKERRVGGAVFVAGFLLPLTGLTEKSEKEVDHEWAEFPIDFTKVRPHLRSSVAIFSDNDTWVSIENVEKFKSKLGSETVVLHEQGHFNEGSNFTELPLVLEKLLEMAA